MFYSKYLHYSRAAAARQPTMDFSINHQQGVQLRIWLKSRILDGTEDPLGAIRRDCGALTSISTASDSDCYNI